MCKQACKARLEFRRYDSEGPSHSIDKASADKIRDLHSTCRSHGHRLCKESTLVVGLPGEGRSGLAC